MRLIFWVRWFPTWDSRFRKTWVRWLCFVLLRIWAGLRFFCASLPTLFTFFPAAYGVPCSGLTIYRLQSTSSVVICIGLTAGSQVESSCISNLQFVSFWTETFPLSVGKGVAAVGWKIAGRLFGKGYAGKGLSNGHSEFDLVLKEVGSSCLVIAFFAFSNVKYSNL